MGNSIDKIDEGFYICGVEALNDINALHALGIKCILNAANLDLYGGRRFSNSAGRLPELTSTFEVKCLECQDAEDENISVHFEAVAEFIEQGIQKGGVVVHCAAGVSRASTSCISYLMLKRHLSLEAAFFKVYAARSVIHPNAGFWRQLQDLEAVLRVRGIELAEPDEEVVEAVRGNMANNGDGLGSDPMALIATHHAEALSQSAFVSHYLTATLLAEDGHTFADIQDSLRQARLPGVVLDSVTSVAEDTAAAQVRCKCVPSVDSELLREMFRGIGAVRDATVEVTSMPMKRGELAEDD